MQGLAQMCDQHSHHGELDSLPWALHFHWILRPEGSSEILGMMQKPLIIDITVPRESLNE